MYILCFITQGEGVVLIDGVLRRIRPFELYLLVPGMILEIPELCDTFEYYGIFFEPFTLIKVEGQLKVTKSLSLSGSFLPGQIPVHHPQQMLQRVLQMYESSRGQHKGDSLSLRLQLEDLINAIIRSVPDEQGISDDRIDRSISYMEHHYTGKISIENLAEAAGMVPVAYSRMFRKVTGLSPVEFLSNMRMDKAKQLLDQENSRVKEVAASVGFRSEFYFSRMFQRMVGVSPTIYMKRGTLKVAVASSLGFHEHLQSVGIEPVSVVDLFQYPGLGEKEYAEILDNHLDDLKRSNPELIIADHYHMDFKDTFKQVATPVFLDFSVWDWKRNFLRIAELVDREREAEQMLTRLDLQIADVGQLLRQSLGNERVTIMQVNHRAIGIQGKVDHPLNELIYGELALKPGGQVPADMWRWEMPPESLPVLETEHLFIQEHHVLAGSKNMYERMIQTSAWNEIHAVRNGNVRLIPNWFVMSWTPLGRQHIMNAIMDILAKS